MKRGECDLEEGEARVFSKENINFGFIAIDAKFAQQILLLFSLQSSSSNIEHVF